MRPRGLSIVEVLLTAFMLSMALGLVAVLANSYNQVLVFSASKDKVTAGFDVSFAAIRADLEAATAVQTATAPPLNLTRVDSSTMPMPRMSPAPSPASWDGYRSEVMVAVTYHITPDGLVRTVTSGAGTTVDSLVASGASGFSATEDASQPGLYEVTLTFLDANNRAQVVKTKVYRRVGTR